MNIEIPEKMSFLFDPARFKVAYGGRDGVKSWSFARALLILGRMGGEAWAQARGLPRDLWRTGLRVACGRETMKSIDDSVHQLLEDQIGVMGLGDFYRIGKKIIVGRNGTSFTFHGLRDRSVHNIKSLESADVLWNEEGQNTSKKSWTIVIPTIRRSGSEIWVSFNPELEEDDTYQRFVVHPPPGCVTVKTTYRDNPFLSAESRAAIEHMKATDPDLFENVYEGACKSAVEGAVFKEQLAAAEKDGRICRVPYDPVKPVDTFWDLGFGDNTSIWFVQSIGFEFRVIDFVSDSLKDLSFYLKEIASRPYLYGTHYLPHDAQNRTLAAGGRSIQQQIEGAGHRVRITPRISVADGIAAARTLFGRCWFDSDRCADGIQALRHYCYEFDELMGCFKKEPKHDWASHPADAFRGFATTIKEPARQKAKAEAEGPPARVGIWS